MDGLIALLVIFGIINAITSKNKEKAEEAKKKAGIPQSAVQPQPARAQTAAKPRTQAQPARPKQAAKQAQIPFSKEEWKKYLAEMGKELAAEKANAHSVATAPVQPAAPLVEAHEGVTSTQGESDEEHAKHRRRIAEEEARRRQAHSELEDLRAANLEKLRAAVVMSEVLGKPVSLRSGTGYHR